jgi:hypothetical protein
MPEADETTGTPKCPTCGVLMVAPEGTFLCVTALAQSYQDESGEWRRDEASNHPILPEEVEYLKAHGMPKQFI